MSTRCAIIFTENGNKKPYGVAVYKHSDGYPEGQRWLVDFAEAFCKERGDDLEYCAAQCVAELALTYAKERLGWDWLKTDEERQRRQYTGFGAFVLEEDDPCKNHCDLAFVYRVDLSPKGGRVYWKRAEDGAKWNRFSHKEKAHA